MLTTLQEWMPGEDDSRTLQQITDTLPGYEPLNIHPLVRLFENPVSPIAFKGAISLPRHDCVHILLGRGLLPQDEAFVLGFTMGTAKNISNLEVFLYEEIAKHLYPEEYKLDDNLIKVFELGLEYGKKCKVKKIYDYPFEEHMQLTLRETRELLGIDMQELCKVYEQEQLLLPFTDASKRLPVLKKSFSKRIGTMNPASDTSDNLIEKYNTYNMRPRMEGLLVTLVLLVSICTTAYFIYLRAVEAQQNEIRDGLLRSAQIVVNMLIDPEIHKTFTRREDEQTPAYQKAIRPLETLLETDPEVRFTYTNVLKDGKVYFVLDGTPNGDWDGDGVQDEVGVMEEYADASKDLKTALKEHRVVVSKEPYKDKWGWFVSAQVPFYDRNNEFVGVYVLAVDARQYFEHLAPIQRATIRAVVIGVLLSVLGGITVWFLRRFSQEINTNRMRVLSELKDTVTIVQTVTKKNMVMLSSVEKELRTPINAIRGFVENLLKNPEPAAVEEAQLQTVKESSDSLVNIINDMFDLSKIEAGTINLKQDKINLRDTVHRVRQALDSETSKRGLRFDIEIAENVPEHVRGDEGRIDQVLVNLAGNAVKFTEKGGVMVAVAVFSEQEDKVHLQFKVSDTGIGMSQEVVDKIFERFSQVDKTIDGQFGRTGLGLTIYRSLVRLMGGEIIVESEVGKGTTFTFTLVLDKAGELAPLQGKAVV